MYFKRPSFRRGGSTGIGQLSSNRQMYAGGGNIGGGIISGSNLGTRSGFVSPSSFPGFEFLESGIQNELRSQMKPSSGQGLTKGSRGARLLSQLRKLSVPGATTVAGTLAIPAATVYGLAQLNKAKTLEGLNYMKSMNQSGVFDETDPEGFNEYTETLKKIDDEGKTKITLKDNFLMDEKGRYPNFVGRTEDRDDKRKDEILQELYNEDRGFLPTPRFDSDQTVNMESIVEEMVPNKKTDDTPKEPSFEDIYQTEFDKIQKLIGNDNKKGMAAIAVSEAIGTPGTIADKAAVLNKSLLGIMVGKKKDKKDIAMLAYKATKQIEAAKIAAGKEGFSERNYKRMTELQKIISDTTGTYNEAQKKAAAAEYAIAEKVISSVGGKKETGLSAVDSKAIQSLDILATKLARLDKDSAGYKKAYDQYLRARIVVLKNKNLADLVALADAQVGLEFRKDGGRIGYAFGSPIEQITETETVETSETPTAQVSRLSFEELRDRLPPEVTDDVIRFLTQSEQALQDFAYIRTAGDIRKFNMKYGLNLVLPAQA